MDWKLRTRVFLQRLWQPTCACMFCMTAPTFANLLSAVHWKTALQTGIGTGVLALLLTLLPVGRLFARRYGNAFLMGALTAIADAWRVGDLGRSGCPASSTAIPGVSLHSTTTSSRGPARAQPRTSSPGPMLPMLPGVVARTRRGTLIPR